MGFVLGDSFCFEYNVMIGVRSITLELENSEERTVKIDRSKGIIVMSTEKLLSSEEPPLGTKKEVEGDENGEIGEDSENDKDSEDDEEDSKSEEYDVWYDHESEVEDKNVPNTEDVDKCENDGTDSGVKDSKKVEEETEDQDNDMNEQYVSRNDSLSVCDDDNGPEINEEEISIGDKGSEGDKGDDKRQGCNNDDTVCEDKNKKEAIEISDKHNDDDFDSDENPQEVTVLENNSKNKEEKADSGDVIKDIKIEVNEESRIVVLTSELSKGKNSENERENEASKLEYEDYEDISENIDILEYEEDCERDERLQKSCLLGRYFGKYSKSYSRKNKKVGSPSHRKEA